MIYDTYHGYWWKCDICGKASSPLFKYYTERGAKRGLKKHNKTHTNVPISEG